jgi:hypothetical protein
MNTTTVATATSRPNRILIALAAAWMILSIAIGGAVSAETTPDAARTQTVIAAQP